MGNKETKKQSPKSPLDLWRMMGGHAERVRSKEGRAADSMLAVYKDRFTYTFIMDHEVASIHFDKTRGEIFFRGHNLLHCELDVTKIKALEAAKAVLAGEERAKSFLVPYEATLTRALAENKNGRKPAK